MASPARTDLTSNLYQLNGRLPLLQAVPFGLQHILAMFVANIAPLLIVAGVVKMPVEMSAALVQVSMLIAGIGTLLQLYPVWRVGSGLPIVMGISFTFVPVFCLVGTQYGYGAALGAALVGGVIEALLGLGAKYWQKFVPQVVAGSVVTAIGFSLLNVGANSFGGGFGNPNFGDPKFLVVGTVTLLSCILFTAFAKSFYKQLGVLFGLAVGYVLSMFLGMVDFSQVAQTSLIAIPEPLPFKLEFRLDAIVSVTLIFLVSASETIGDTTALAMMGLRRPAMQREVSGSLATDGLVSSLSAVFGCMPITSFSQNIGLVALTKVVNRFAIMTGAVIMLAAGLFPWFGKILATLPEPVLGGCTLMMFGSIVLAGVRMLSKCIESQRNMTIASLSLAIGIGFTQAPAIFNICPQILKDVLAGNSVAVVFLVAVILNIVLPSEKASGEPVNVD